MSLPADLPLFDGTATSPLSSAVVLHVDDTRSTALRVTGELCGLSREQWIGAHHEVLRRQDLVEVEDRRNSGRGL